MKVKSQTVSKHLMNPRTTPRGLQVKWEKGEEKGEGGGGEFTSIPDVPFLTGKRSRIQQCRNIGGKSIEGMPIRHEFLYFIEWVNAVEVYHKVG